MRLPLSCLGYFTWGRRGRKFAKALLIATCTSIAAIGCLGGKFKSGEGGRW